MKGQQNQGLLNMRGFHGAGWRVLGVKNKYIKGVVPWVLRKGALGIGVLRSLLLSWQSGLDNLHFSKFFMKSN